MNDLQAMKTKFRTEVKEVLEGSRESTSSTKVISIEDCLDIIKSIGYDYTEVSSDTNGWQMDFWWNIEVETKQYTISGSGYCGDLIFGVKEE
ncbi:MAG: hypothetical protein KAS32_16225 [Candidatus Peribacteraceae bacterium]|nr:hypothetical protein [Candidatus Peribacteraceae bacterium]